MYKSTPFIVAFASVALAQTYTEPAPIATSNGNWEQWSSAAAPTTTAEASTWGTWAETSPCSSSTWATWAPSSSSSSWANWAPSSSSSWATWAPSSSSSWATWAPSPTMSVAPTSAKTSPAIATYTGAASGLETSKLGFFAAGLAALYFA